MNHRQGGRKQNPHHMSLYNYKKLFIHNIDYKTSYDEIYSEFARIGKLRYCDVPVEKNGKLKGYAFVEYYDAKLAEVALNKLNNTQIGIRPIKIEFSNKTKEGVTTSGNQKQKNDPFPSREENQHKHQNNRRSRSYESYRSYERYSKSPNGRESEHGDYRVPLSQNIRKQYLSDFYTSDEFYDKTPSINDMESFLNSTLKESYSTVISTSKKGLDRQREYDGRRRERAQDSYADDRERMTRKESYQNRHNDEYDSDDDLRRNDRDREYSRRERM
jgi:RNA recognition motif-containing protein